MRRVLTVFLALFLLVPLVATAEVYEVRSGLKVVLPEISEPWVVTKEATPALVEHLAEHLMEDAAKKGRSITKEQAMTGARQRLANNELMIFNEKTEAHVLLSFSPLRRGEADPSARSVQLSAQYAAEGVTDEGWSDITVHQEATTVKGAQQAQYFRIDYTEDGDRHLFMGIVGFARPYWFWVYANDHLKDPGDRAVLENILNQIEIRVE
jgi:hypothetical protein